MNARPRLALHVDDGVDSIVRARIEFAFRLYCVVAGIAAVDATRADLALRYGGPPGDDLSLPATYRARPASEPAPPPTLVTPAPGSSGRALPCLHPCGLDGAPDLLGEIFEWVSGDHERSIESRDAEGRIPYRDTLHGLYGLSPRVPWATEAMRWLHARIRSHPAARDWPVRLVGPLERSVVAVTHDLDFLAGSWRQTSARLTKNLVRPVVGRDPALAAQVVRAGASTLLGDNPLDRLSWLIEREVGLGIGSSVNVLCRREHRRDGNYRLTEPRTRRVLGALQAAGVEIGLHGSYTSLEAPGRLADEYAILAHAGYEARGGRQHWLRYADARLFDELVRAGASYDSSAGYSSEPGFRQGASFPYPPWDFEREAPYPLLEVPLVLMDGALEGHVDWERRTREVMDSAVGAGWGGVSILWHDTVFGGAQLDRRIADAFWELRQPDHDWTSAGQLVDAVWPSYARSGLLPPMPPT